MKRKIVIVLFIFLLTLCLFATVSCDTEGGTNGEGKYTVSFVVDNNIYSTVNNFSSTSEIPSIPTKEGKQRLIDGFINAIYLYDDKITFTFNYKDGTKTVFLSELNCTPSGSNLKCLGAPKNDKYQLVVFLSIVKTMVYPHALACISSPKAYIINRF